MDIKNNYLIKFSKSTRLSRENIKNFIKNQFYLTKYLYKNNTIRYYEENRDNNTT